MATATAPTMEERVYELLTEVGEDVRLVADIVKKFDEKVLSVAWIQGVIEFGRITHIVAGMTPMTHEGVPQARSRSEGSRIIVESGMMWSKAKGTLHKPMKDLLTEDAAMGEFRRYQKYVPNTKPGPNGQPPEPGSMMLVDITREQARAEVALRIRITDAGYARLRG